MLFELVYGRVLDFLRRDFEEDEVKVEVYKEGFKLVTFEGVLEMVKGAEYTIPRWIAEVLGKKGYVRIKDTRIPVGELSVLAYNEEAGPHKPLTNKLKGFFYMAMFKARKEIVEEAKSTGDLSKLDELKRIEDSMDSILKTRVKKILNYSLLPDVQQDIEEKLSEEEKYLSRTLRSILALWRRKLGE